MNIIISVAGREAKPFAALKAVTLLYKSKIPDESTISTLDGIKWSAVEWYTAMHREPVLEERRVAGTRQNPPEWQHFQRAVGVWLTERQAGTGAEVLPKQAFAVPGTSSEIRPDYIVWNDPEIEQVVDAKHKAEGSVLLPSDVLQVWTYSIVLGCPGAVVVPAGTKSAHRARELRNSLGVKRYSIDFSAMTTPPPRRR